MGKLILGIIAVLILQIAFLRYATRESPALRSSHLSNEPVAEAPAADRSGAAPAAVSPKPGVTPSSDQEPVKLRPRPATNRPRGGVREDLRAQTSEKVVPPKRDRRTYSVKQRNKPSPEHYAAHPHRDRLIPKGYTMVLVERMPVEPVIKTKEVQKPRKRSYLERTLPALVKKPWRWVKSLASKIK